MKLQEGWDENRTVRTRAGQEQSICTTDSEKGFGSRQTLKAESEGLGGGWYKLREENKHGSALSSL